MTYVSGKSRRNPSALSCHACCCLDESPLECRCSRTSSTHFSCCRPRKPRRRGSITNEPSTGSAWRLALLALEWDTGCRASELLELRWEWLDWDRAWLIVPAAVRKGQRRDAAYGLMPDTMRLLASIRQPSGRILRWDLDRSRYYQLWKELLLAAGLPTGRHFKTQWLRRSFASHLQAGGGDATAALGHSSRSTTLNHYLDPTLTAARAGESMPFRLLDFREGTSGA